MGDISDHDTPDTNLLRSDKSPSSSSHYANYPTPSSTTPTPTTNPATSSSSAPHHNHHLQKRGGGDPNNGMALINNKAYSHPSGGDPAMTNAAGAGGGGGADSARLQRKVARLTSYLYGLTVVVIVGGVILIATIASLYAKLYHDLTHHSHQPKVGEQISKILEREELCVPCSEVRLGPSPEEEAMLNVFTKRDSREGQKCCVERPAELLRLLELYINKTYRQEIAKGHISMRQSSSSDDPQDKPAAHLMGYPQRQDQNQAPGRQFPISMWIYREDLAFINHVTYRYGRIVVPDDGLYYVYSQVAFLEVLSPSNGGSGGGGGSGRSPSSAGAYGTESPSLSHYLYRYNIIYPNGGEEKLVQNSITKCWGPNRAFGEYTSYLGAVFHLRQGDEVFVKVSNLTMMALDPKSNYFGLFKL
ncbi:uncharacterized protein LOC143289179 [Babylonia areolata]|uniref:uncharacterized protein LOC143289179 n=1 Tax=Babylonia areolata TaxID=304850 RepID=UPI003FCF5EEA